MQPIALWIDFVLHNVEKEEKEAYTFISSSAKALRDTEKLHRSLIVGGPRYPVGRTLYFAACPHMWLAGRTI